MEASAVNATFPNHFVPGVGGISNTEIAVITGLGAFRWIRGHGSVRPTLVLINRQGQPVQYLVPGEHRGATTASELNLGTGESWGRPGTLADHFRRHGADFGARTADEYASMASKFLQESQARGLPTRIGPDGVIRIYDPATNTFGSYNASGTTKTFYRPNPTQHGYPTNLDYWNAQKGDSPWEP